MRLEISPRGFLKLLQPLMRLMIGKTTCAELAKAKRFLKVVLKQAHSIRISANASTGMGRIKPESSSQRRGPTRHAPDTLRYPLGIAPWRVVLDECTNTANGNEQFCEGGAYC